MKSWLKSNWIECWGILILLGIFLDSYTKISSWNNRFLLLVLFFVMVWLEFWISRVFLKKDDTKKLNIDNKYSDVDIARITREENDFLAVVEDVKSLK